MVEAVHVDVTSDAMKPKSGAKHKLDTRSCQGMQDNKGTGRVVFMSNLHDLKRSEIFRSARCIAHQVVFDFSMNRQARIMHKSLVVVEFGCMRCIWTQLNERRWYRVFPCWTRRCAT